MAEASSIETGVSMTTADVTTEGYTGVYTTHLIPATSYGSNVTAAYEGAELDLGAAAAGENPVIARAMSCTLIIVGSLTIFINIFVLMILAKYKWMRSNANLIIGSMAVTDLIAGGVTLTGGIVKWTDWTTVSMLFCQFLHTFDGIGAWSSVGHVWAVNGERYLAIVFPLRYKDLVTEYRIKVVLAFIWAYGFAGAVGYTFAATMVGNCLMFRYAIPGLAFAILVMVVFIPFISVLYFYFHIVYVVIGKLRFMAKSSNLDQAALARSQRKMFTIVSAILVAWILCWLPTMTVLLAVSFSETFNVYFDQSSFVTMYYFVEVTSYGNSIVNPILYFLTSSDFRKAGLDLFKCVKSTDATKNSSTSTVDTTTTKI